MHTTKLCLARRIEAVEGSSFDEGISHPVCLLSPNPMFFSSRRGKGRGAPRGGRGMDDSGQRMPMSGGYSGPRGGHHNHYQHHGGGGGGHHPGERYHRGGYHHGGPGSDRPMSSGPGGHPGGPGMTPNDGNSSMGPQRGGGHHHHHQAIPSPAPEFEMKGNDFPALPVANETSRKSEAGGSGVPPPPANVASTTATGSSAAWESNSRYLYREMYSLFFFS